jgi:hypothetical protein
VLCVRVMCVLCVALFDSHRLQSIGTFCLTVLALGNIVSDTWSDTWSDTLSDTVSSTVSNTFGTLLVTTLLVTVATYGVVAYACCASVKAYRRV